ncbi:uncharacterized protein LOC118676752 [Myotis myotis]|uniref:uncharacterized protein LOC118676752 n=1 Tax=Myotis myotis TaxID=51298 RepID=UPI0017480368|nr:uncharacterized protein LOC118676752 [Myotis myotis]XP_036207057.1 uncharacterized protein LOC118676752 [Myotis myotis]
MKDPAGGVCEEEAEEEEEEEEEEAERKTGVPAAAAGQGEAACSPEATFLEKDHTCAYSRFGGEHHHALGYDPTFPSASPHIEPEGDLSVFHFMGSLLRESCGHPERTPPARTETDRLPWLSYHSADAVHSKGTVL